MKEIEAIHTDKEIEQRQHEKKQVIAQLVHKPGLTLFDFDPETKTIVKAEFQSVFDVKQNEYVKSVITKPGHLYLEALNMKNAAKKFSKLKL